MTSKSCGQRTSAGDMPSLNCLLGVCQASMRLTALCKLAVAPASALSGAAPLVCAASERTCMSTLCVESEAKAHAGYGSSLQETAAAAQLMLLVRVTASSDQEWHAQASSSTHRVCGQQPASAALLPAQQAVSGAPLLAAAWKSCVHAASMHAGGSTAVHCVARASHSSSARGVHLRSAACKGKAKAHLSALASLRPDLLRSCRRTHCLTQRGRNSLSSRCSSVP